MHEIDPEPELAARLDQFKQSGGVLDFIFVQPDRDAPAEESHRAAALAGMAAIDRRIKGSKSKFRLVYDESKLTGTRVPFNVFFGNESEAQEHSSNPEC